MNAIKKCFYRVLLIFLICSPIALGAALVQAAKCQDWSGYAVKYQCSFTHDTTPENAIIVFVLVSGTRDVVVTNVVDDHKPSSNNYALDLHYLFGDLQNTYFYSAAGAGATRTVTFSANISTHFQVVMMEVSGLPRSGPLVDRTSTNDNGYNTGRTFTSGLTQPTTQREEFLVGWSEQVYPNVMTFADDAPWTLVEQQTLGGSRIAYRTTTAIGKFAYTGSFTGEGNYRVGAAIVTYRVANAKHESMLDRHAGSLQGNSGSDSLPLDTRPDFTESKALRRPSQFVCWRREVVSSRDKL